MHRSTLENNEEGTGDAQRPSRGGGREVRGKMTRQPSAKYRCGQWHRHQHTMGNGAESGRA